MTLAARQASCHLLRWWTSLAGSRLSNTLSASRRTHNKTLQRSIILLPQHARSDSETEKFGVKSSKSSEWNWKDIQKAALRVAFCCVGNIDTWCLITIGRRWRSWWDSWATCHCRRGSLTPKSNTLPLPEAGYIAFSFFSQIKQIKQRFLFLIPCGNDYYTN